IALLLAACGGPDAAPDGGGDGDASAPDAGIGDAGTDAGGSDAGTGDAGGDPAALCDPATLEGRLEGGAWDGRFTIPGMLGYDGFVPSVHSLARDADGSLLVAGYFVWAGSERVSGLARRRADGA